ncbi:COG4223 family protein [Bartonella queenslandensis]|uniref:COG4223 family protein n=1 Tax=Bartonella queenslandensis TaxID=481138 RepID=UPI001BA5FFD3|nr:mitofilin family membrane protein [Bartonella queenslandensis]
MVDSSKPKVKSHYAGTRRKKPVIEHEVVSHDSEKEIQDSVESYAQEKQNMQNQDKSTSGTAWLLLLLSGILGGIIALGVFVGLQWAGLFSSPFVENSVGEKNVLQIVETAKSQGEEARKQLKQLFQEIDALKTEFSSFSSQQFKTTTNNELSKEESRQAFAILEEKVKALEEAVQTLVGAPKEIEMALSVGQSNANDLAALKKQLEAFQEEITVKNSEKRGIDMALFTAISSLKNAVERGGSYSNELKLLQQLSPSIDGLDVLQKTATVGLPSSAQLSIDFAHVADAIVRTQNIVASDAGFFDRILAWIKGLVVSRPIGNVEGTTLGAIAARMEVAIQAGDYEKALSEWQSLPQSAKDVSMDFVQKLERHITVQQLLQQLLLSVQQGSFKATKM